jgi:hypothetical protein
MPAIREGTIVMFGIERPDIEVLDALLTGQVVQGGTLTQHAAQKTASIASCNLWPAGEQLGFRPDSKPG